jgi:signal transduction histidine kinase
MRKSFKFHLFLRLVLMIFVIIGANRLIAQQFLTEQLRGEIHQKMGFALSACELNFHSRQDFLACFKDNEPGSLISNVADYYVMCPEQTDIALKGLSAICDRHVTANIWHSKESFSHESIQFSSGEVNDEAWLVVRFLQRTNGPEVWLKQDDADRMVIQMWSLRDRNLMRVLPIVLAMVFLLNLYITRILMNPVNTIQESMSEMNASNLHVSAPLQAPYREFEKMVQVFADLRSRLDSSFIKARRFASDASHELRTPLTILRGNVEKLIHDLPSGSDAQVRMRLMGDEVERLIDITEKLLLLSRADANSLQQELIDVDLSELLNQLIHDAHTFQVKLKIKSDIQPGVIWRCDKTLVRQLINNLYTNAVNYNRPEGWIHIALKQSDGQMFMTFENTTSELADDLSERAFERFYRGDASHTREVDGIGLGLSICLEIARLHQGKLALSLTQQRTVLVSLSAPLIAAP